MSRDDDQWVLPRTRLKTEDVRRFRAVETARNRMLATGLIFAFAFLVIAGRLIDLTMFGPGGGERSAVATQSDVGRGDIVDRNGTVLATSLPTPSVFADPQEIIDVDAAVQGLMTVLPELDRQALRNKLASNGRFVWVQRLITLDEKVKINRLGIPGIGFIRERRRFYPTENDAAHVLGFTDIDGHGIAGVEESFESSLSKGETVALSLDIRIQQLLRTHLDAARREFNAIGGAGIVLDVHTGEVLALVSLPDFNPNAPVTDPEDDARFNRITKGVYEMGSTFKLFTLAMALDSGVTTLRGGYDASRPIRIARYTISDYHGKGRWLSVPEILIHSSNIGSALMGVDVGTSRQKQYLQQFGILSKASIELPEVGSPLIPEPWREINTMTIAFGHGLAATPLQLAAGVSAIVNDGVLRRPTLLRHQPDDVVGGTRAISEKTSRQMRDLMRLVVQHGTGSKANVPGYDVGGKTGTAEKLVHGQYLRNARIASFVGAFPMSAPRFVVVAMLDEPKGNRRTFNYATGGWVAAPVVAGVVREMAPILGIPPEPTEEAESASKTSKPVTANSRKSAVRAAIARVQGKQFASN
ncbi:MAG: penicillin-binding protein 2 [Rhodospirillales bacterium]|nr:penicillin-binding protein 2 [Rhodospirillales bacterium]